MWVFLLASAFAFGSKMSQEDLKKTGVGRLSLREREALQEWIEKRYQKKAPSSKKKEPLIEEVLSGGRFIRLSDRSLWEIHLDDTPITRSWISPSEIKKEITQHKDFPYALTNTLTGSTVRAQKADQVE